jgi:hypothetical protein
LVVGEPEFLEGAGHLLQARDLLDVVAGQGQAGEVLEGREVHDFVDAVGRDGQLLHTAQRAQRTCVQLVDRRVLHSHTSTKNTSFIYYASAAAFPFFYYHWLSAFDSNVPLDIL